MNGGDPDAYWIVIQFKHGQLERARRELNRQGFELFCPLVRKSGPSPAPMLKTYAFLHVSEGSEALRKVIMTRGVHATIGPSRSAPTRVRPELVEAIRSRCDEDDVFQFGSVRADDASHFLSDTHDMNEEERGFLFLRHL